MHFLWVAGIIEPNGRVCSLSLSERKTRQPFEPSDVHSLLLKRKFSMHIHACAYICIPGISWMTLCYLWTGKKKHFQLTVVINFHIIFSFLSYNKSQWNVSVLLKVGSAVPQIFILSVYLETKIVIFLYCSKMRNVFEIIIYWKTFHLGNSQ